MIPSPRTPAHTCKTRTSRTTRTSGTAAGAAPSPTPATRTTPPSTAATAAVTPGPPLTPTRSSSGPEVLSCGAAAGRRRGRRCGAAPDLDLLRPDQIVGELGALADQVVVDVARA